MTSRRDDLIVVADALQAESDQRAIDAEAVSSPYVKALNRALATSLAIIARDIRQCARERRESSDV